MTSSMPYMTTLLDQAKTSYTITDKSTGKFLGVALMLVDDKVTQDQVQLLPWHAHNDKQKREKVHQQPPNQGVDEGTMIPGSLASDLDISEDSSVNSYAEDTKASIGVSGNVQLMNIVPVDSNTNIIKTNTSEASVNEGNVVQSNVDYRSRVKPAGSQTVPTSQSVTQSLAAQIAAQLKEATEDKIKECLVNKNSLKMSLKSNDDSEHGSRKIAALEKRKLEAGIGMQLPSKRVAHAQFGPGKFGRFRSFYTDVGVDQPQNKKFKQVKCLLCTGEKILAIGNFGEHVKACHLPPVRCTKCGGEYSRAGIRRHTRTCTAKISGTDSLEDEEREKDVDIVHVTDSPDTKPAAKTHKSSAGSGTNSEGIKVENCSGDESFSGEKAETKDEDKFKFILRSASVQGMRVKIRLRKGAKIKKAMKQFGKKFNISRKDLKFELGGELLSGEELVDGLEGREIVVAGKLN